MIKGLLKQLYAMLPNFLLINTNLRKFIHHKPIPKSVSKFTVSGTDVVLWKDESPIITAVYWLGLNGYEPNELKLYIHLCEKVSSIVEIGGNVGYFTVFGAKASPSNAYSVYEPLPYCFELLNINLELNNLSSVNAVNAAVVKDNSSSSIKLCIPVLEGYQAATGGFIEGAEAIDRPVGKVVDVNTIGSREVIRGSELIKIDVEGAEFEILSSASKELAESQSIILVEMRRGTDNLRDWIVEFTIKNRYKIFALSEFDGTLHEINVNEVKDIVLQEKYGTRDVIMCPSNKVQILDDF